MASSSSHGGEGGDSSPTLSKSSKLANSIGKKSLQRATTHYGQVGRPAKSFLLTDDEKGKKWLRSDSGKPILSRATSLGDIREQSWSFVPPPRSRPVVALPEKETKEKKEKKKHKKTRTVKTLPTKLDAADVAHAASERMTRTATAAIVSVTAAEHEKASHDFQKLARVMTQRKLTYDKVKKIEHTEAGADLPKVEDLEASVIVRAPKLIPLNSAESLPVSSAIHRPPMLTVPATSGSRSANSSPTPSPRRSDRADDTSPSSSQNGSSVAKTSTSSGSSSASGTPSSSTSAVQPLAVSNAQNSTTATAAKEQTAEEKKEAEMNKQWAKRLQVLQADGIEVGMVEGRPVILAGTLEKILDRLATYIASSHSLQTIINQIEALWIAFPRFCNQRQVVELLQKLYFGPLQLPPGASAAAEQKWREKRQEGVIKLLHMWVEKEWSSEVFREKDFRDHISKLLDQMHFDPNVYSKQFIDTLKPIIAECWVMLNKASAAAALSPRHARFDLPTSITSISLALGTAYGAGVSKEAVAGGGGTSPHPGRTTSTEAPEKDEEAPNTDLMQSMKTLFGKKSLVLGKFEFIDLNPKDVAEVLTWMDFQVVLARITRNELLTQNWMKASAGDTTIRLAFQRGDRIAKWVATEICSTEPVGKRAEVLSRFITVADKCYELNNFNSLLHILSGLNHCSVLRLKRTWEKISPSVKKKGEELTQLMTQYGNYKAYREKLKKKQDKNEAVMPSLDVLTRDLVFFDENPNTIGKSQFINFDKFLWMANYILQVEGLQARIAQMEKAGTLRKQLIGNDRVLSDFFSDPKPRIDKEPELYKKSLQAEPRVKTDA